MPWKEVKPMDEKLLFIADCLRETDSLSQLCSHYGISRKTGYKWLDRYRGAGLDGLEERSRRPHTAVGETPYAIRQTILELRRRGHEPPGPKKLQALLAARFPDQPPPCRTTIYSILKHAGLIEPQRRRRRVAPQPGPLASASTPNVLWSADYKGQFKTGDGRWCYPLTVMDHASRYLLCCQGLEGTRFTDAQAIFERLFREYGLPERVRTDNGVPFASPGPAGLSRLSIWWVRLGIRPERIEPGRPQQNGRHERMHRTLKRAVTHPPALNLPSQQVLFDEFQHQYNEERPHESLAQISPAHCYAPSVRPYPDRLPELAYPSWFLRHKVATNGLAYCLGLRVYMGYLLAGQWVGLEAMDDGVWDVYFGPLRLGRFDERDTRGRLNDYIVLKV
jgi:putative transposase